MDPYIAAALSGAGRTSVVFLAAAGDPAIETFRETEMDYVLKPVHCAPVLEVVQRVRARRQLTAETPAASDAVRDESIWVSGRSGLARIALATVESFEAERDYVCVSTGDARRLMRGPLQAVALRLDPMRFVRIHRSAIVNVDQIDEMRRWRNGRMRLRFRPRTDGQRHLC